jgi:acetyl-CoA acyltransferase 1
MVGIAAGVESMSQTPMNKIRPPHIGGGDDEQVVWKTQVPPAALDCLLPMGITSDTVADRYQLKREDLDSFATESHRRALAAQQQGKFRAEMVRVGSVSMDDGIRPGTTVETLARLKPVFTPTGLTTAGNSSQTTDGAAGVLMMKRCTARKLGMSALATWKCYACVGVPPAVMGIGPAVAIPRVLSDLQLTVQDIEVFEINEAFASQAYYCVQQLGLDPLRVNPNGGAIALGHPLGATGVRLAVSIIYELRRRQKNQQQEKKIESDDRGTVTTTKGLGVVSMCVGTGMGAAAVLQVEPASAL